MTPFERTFTPQELAEVEIEDTREVEGQVAVVFNHSGMWWQAIDVPGQARSGGVVAEVTTPPLVIPQPEHVQTKLGDQLYDNLLQMKDADIKRLQRELREAKEELTILHDLLTMGLDGMSEEIIRARQAWHVFRVAIPGLPCPRVDYAEGHLRFVWSRSTFYAEVVLLPGEWDLFFRDRETNAHFGGPEKERFIDALAKALHAQKQAEVS